MRSAGAAESRQPVRPERLQQTGGRGLEPRFPGPKPGVLAGYTIPQGEHESISAPWGKVFRPGRVQTYVRGFVFRRRGARCRCRVNELCRGAPPTWSSTGRRELPTPAPICRAGMAGLDRSFRPGNCPEAGSGAPRTRSVTARGRFGGRLRQRYCGAQCGVRHDNRKRDAQPGRRKVERPVHEQLLADLAVLSMRAVGAKYAVSDNAVRKWIRSYERGESDAPMSARLGGGRK